MKGYRNPMLVGVQFALVLSVFLTVGCGGNKKPGPAPAATPAQPNSSTATFISAEPNPVPAGPEKGGRTKITWSAGPGNTGEVYLSTNGGAEKLFGGIAPKGSQEVNWISAGPTYEFRLYEGKGHQKVLASVKVTRDKSQK